MNHVKIGSVFMVVRMERELVDGGIGGSGFSENTVSEIVVRGVIVVEGDIEIKKVESVASYFEGEVDIRMV